MIKVLRGNLGQGLIFEGMLTVTGSVLLVEKGGEKPMFPVEQDNPSASISHKLTVSVNVWHRECIKCGHKSKEFYGNHVNRDKQDCPKCKEEGTFISKFNFLPKFYTARFHFDLVSQKSYVKTSREVIDFVCSTVPDADRILAAMEQSEEKEK